MKNKKISLCAVLLVSFLSWGSLGFCFSQNEFAAKTHKVGESIVKGRRAALRFPINGNEISRGQIHDYIQMVSRHNLEEIAFNIGFSSELEKLLFNKIRSVPVPIVTRTSVTNLRKILQNHALMSPVEGVRRDLAVNKTVTPDLEEMLFGAYGCIFATVGLIDGSSRYGDVVIRLRNAIQEVGWATPWSGHYFFSNLRQEDTHLLEARIKSGDMKEISSDIYLQFSHFLIAGRDWNDALAWQAINYLRCGLDDAEKAKRRELALKLLKETDDRRFWQAFAKDGAYTFGYLEAKFEGYLPLASVESIEVEKQHLSEVLSWPEAQIFRHRIRVLQE